MYVLLTLFRLSWFHWLFFPSSRGVCNDLAVAYQCRVTRPSRDDAAAIHWLSAVGSCRAFRNHLLPSFANLATFRPPSSFLFVFFFLPSEPFLSLFVPHLIQTACFLSHCILRKLTSSPSLLTTRPMPVTQ
ncbi:hypothetical protein QL093DRAFT_1442798 [Fusarium oxysporum]|nr:hypothetical protein QL093DRAFT_1442798 [Fusarium oxysporum]